jgi:PPM family protein phosphatase
MRLEIGAATDVGQVREVNEDGYLVDEPLGLMAVADGVGGHRAGEVASATALEALRAALGSGRSLREAIEEANEAVFTKSLSNEDFRGMGTTLTAGTMATGGTFIVGHVGDSRAYLLRGGELRQLTTDHSRVQELVDDGRLTADEAAVHPMRNVITRALGMDATVDVDIHPVQLEPGDRVLFCSDGLTGMLRDDLVGAELRRDSDLSRVVARLIDAANSAGGEDNITVVVAIVTADDAPRAEAPVAAPVAEPVRDEPDAGGTERHRPHRRTRRVGRVLLWVIPVLVILGVAIGAIAWYANNNYYVGAHRGRVTVYRGVPGGLLWWDPTVERRTDLSLGELRAVDAADVRAERTFSSREDANAFVRRIRSRVPPTTTTTVPTTTTTTLPTTTVPPPPLPPPETTAVLGP